MNPIIIKRKSIRKYKDEPFTDGELKAIQSAIDGAKPLYAGINTEASLLTGEEYRKAVGGLFIVQAPYYIVIKSEQKEGYLVNAGYLGQKIILRLTEMNIGTCWLGGAKSKNKQECADGGAEASALSYVISIALGKPAEKFREDESDASRKDIEDIASGEIEKHRDVLSAARLAPSAMNKQPARYLCAANKIDVFKKKTLLPMLLNMQVIDCGIAIANMIYCDPSYKFGVDPAAEVPQQGWTYIGSLTN